MLEILDRSKRHVTQNSISGLVPYITFLENTLSVILWKGMCFYDSLLRAVRRNLIGKVIKETSNKIT